jgi:hypothetical protein
MSDYDYDEGYRAGMQKMREVGQRRIEELEAKLAKAMQVVEMIASADEDETLVKEDEDE